MILLKSGLHRFKVHLKSTNELLDTIDLDLTQEPETFEILYEKSRIRHQRWTGQIVQKFRGWRLMFSLNYSVKSNDLLVDKIGKLIDYGAENQVYYMFYPRSDDTSFYLEVLDDNDELRLKLLSADDAYEGLQLKYVSKDLINKLNWISPTNLAATYGGRVHPFVIEGEKQN